MPAGQDGPDSPLSLGHRPGLSHDPRVDSGYGTLKDKFHASRSKGATFPYTEEDQEEEVDLGLTDDEIVKLVNKMATPYKSSDSLISRSIDKNTFANGNRPVAIGEASGRSLVPFPGMYKKRMQVGGGVNSPKLVSPGQYNRTGTYRGWSHAPIPLDTEPRNKENLSPDEEALEKVRDLVRAVLDANSKEV